jgi:hypothetical protein
VRAYADAGVGDHELRRAEAPDEVGGRPPERRRIGDVDRIANHGARQTGAALSAGNQSEDRVRGSVVAGKRLTDARGGAGDDNGIRGQSANSGSGS